MLISMYDDSKKMILKFQQNSSTKRPDFFEKYCLTFDIFLISHFRSSFKSHIVVR